MSNAHYGPHSKITLPVASDLNRTTDAAWCLHLDHAYLAWTYQQQPATPGFYRPGTGIDERPPMRLTPLPYATIVHIESGTVHLKGGQSVVEIGKDWGAGPTQYVLQEGPAIWIRSVKWTGDRSDLVLHHPQARSIATELEKRRQRVAVLGGYEAQKHWRIHPFLRVQTDDGPRACLVTNPPQAPKVPQLTSWVSDGPIQAEAEDTAVPNGDPLVFGDAAYPETATDYSIPMGNAQLSVTIRRLFLASYEIKSEPSVLVEPDYPYPPNFVDVPFAALPIIQEGIVSGLGTSQAQYLVPPDASTRLSLPIENGPAVWIWGPHTNLVLNTQLADQLATDLRERRKISARFPFTEMEGPERKVWFRYPELRWDETTAGFVLPPPPAYAPITPPDLPPGTWSPK